MTALMDQEITLARQRHKAHRAGDHHDYRIVVGDKAYSFATKKGMPGPKKRILLWEQPVHSRKYALTKDIYIPEGQYGAGEQFIDYLQDGKADIHEDHYKLRLNDGNRFTIRRMDPDKFGQGAWMMMNTRKENDEPS